jgi:hypothetical protein
MNETTPNPTAITPGSVEGGKAPVDANVSNPEGQGGAGSLLSKPVDKKSEETGKPEDKTQTDEAVKSEGIPEKYEFKAPEGLELNSELVEQFTPIAKELNLTNEQAQKLIDLYGNQILTLQKASNEQWQNTMTTWSNSVKADKEIGGAELQASITAARNAMDKFGTPEFKALIDPPSPSNPNGMGLGNNPEVIRLLTRIGKAMSEDQTHLQQGQPPEQPVGKAKTMFPAMN